jgi:hypothetical protein
MSLSRQSATRTPDATYPAQSTAGVLVAPLVLRNNGSSVDNLYFRVASLNNGNYLLNADGGPSQVGSQVSVAASSLPGGNNLWDATETLTQDFSVGMMVAARLQFRVDVYAVTVSAGDADSDPADELLGSFLIELDPAAAPDAVYHLYLPATQR